MLEQSREIIRIEEAARLKRIERRGLVRRILSKKTHGNQDYEKKLVESYRISVEKCFIPLDFDDELPLYLLDLGGTILILFGQWLFDPHTLIAPSNIFEKWNCAQSFFRNCSLGCSGEHGIVFELRVEGACFVPAQRLSRPVRFRRLREWQLLQGQGGTLLQDLQNADIIEALTQKY